MSRLPVDTAMTQADFENCGYEQALKMAYPDYGSMRGVLCRAAENKFLEHKVGESAVLYLFADLCGLLLQPDSFNEPFRPYAIWCERRSMLPDDLSPEQLAFIESIYSRVENNLLRACLAEIVYLKDRKKFEAALAAIAAYNAVALDLKQRFYLEILKYWERGISLAQRLKDKGREPLAELEEKVTTALFSEEVQNDEFDLAVKLAAILQRRSLGFDKAAKIAEFLEAKAETFKKKGNVHRVGAYYDAARQWYHKAKMVDAEYRVTALKAAATERYANTRKTGERHNLASRCFLEQAIQEYRKLPVAYRNAHGMGSKLGELQAELDKANKEALDSMVSFTTPPVDISPLQKEAENCVMGKARHEAFLHFCALIPEENFENLREKAKQVAEKYILSAIAQRVIINPDDGRVIARDNSKNKLDHKISELHGIRINRKTRSRILPALFVLRCEHRMREQDFYELTHNNPVIPPDREILAAKALYAGYEGDFTAALYMLAPLMEAIVRFHLKMHKVPTTHLDAQGIEQEKGLSTLITEPKCKEIFGENLTEEIRLLFCDSMGANLRNNVAHGLLTDKGTVTSAAVYAWYLLFRIVFNTSYYMSKGAEERA